MAEPTVLGGFIFQRRSDWHQSGLLGYAGPGKAQIWDEVLQFLFYPPASEASREIANLTERKNPHTP